MRHRLSAEVGTNFVDKLRSLGRYTQATELSLASQPRRFKCEPQRRSGLLPYWGIEHTYHCSISTHPCHLTPHISLKFRFRLCKTMHAALFCSQPVPREVRLEITLIPEFLSLYPFFPTATQGFHPFITEGFYRALLYPPSLLNTQFADCIWMYVYRLQINWEI
jgi:hypothetical protein